MPGPFLTCCLSCRKLQWRNNARGSLFYPVQGLVHAPSLPWHPLWISFRHWQERTVKKRLKLKLIPPSWFTRGRNLNCRKSAVSVVFFDVILRGDSSILSSPVRQCDFINLRLMILICYVRKLTVDHDMYFSLLSNIFFFIYNQEHVPRTYIPFVWYLLNVFEVSYGRLEHL